MSLREYRQKRDFTLTAEPEAKKERSSAGNLFVIQKHDASRLHYDFRLEMEGVLKSWAVPKGFPFKKGERHLARHVEDHPLDYARFEGIIPKGQYGGGTVMLWDIGTYEVRDGNPAKALRAGKLSLTLHGGKLKGEWTLVRTSSGDGGNWLILKSGGDVPPISQKRDNQSILSGRTMRQIAEERDAVWQSNRTAGDEPAGKAEPDKGKNAHRTASRKAAEPAKSSTRKVSPAQSRKGGRHKPRWVEPMKATLVDAPPATGDWIYELKWDGFRALAIKDGPKVELISRNQKLLTAAFPEVRDAILQIPAESAILDGEICALDPEGKPSFQLLQSRDMGKERPSIFLYAFDLLHLDGRNLMPEPLHMRKAALEKLLRRGPETLRYSAGLQGDVHALLHEISAHGMEGVIGKLRDSTYEPGVRSRAWIKVKCAFEQEFVIGGFTPPQGARKHFGALLVGYYEDGKLHFSGKVGTGFDHAWLAKLHKQMTRLQTKDCPFADLPRRAGGKWVQTMSPAKVRISTWVKPHLVCQCRFAEWTNDGSLRQPVFLGLREDKDARDVVRERPRQAPS